MDIILRAYNISKNFPGVNALKKVHFELIKGEVHALMGENGAGKSTFIKVLAGIYSCDEGFIEIIGQMCNINSVDNAIKHGISVIHQELQLALEMTVSENIYMGREHIYKKMPLLDHKTMDLMAAEVLHKLDLDIDPTTKVGTLSIANRQMVEIAKAISRNASIIVMDEPTSSLTEKEVDILFNVIRDLRKKGVSIIYISHRLEEVFQISDRITVFRDGCYVDTTVTSKTNRNNLINMMVGRDLNDYYLKKTYVTDEKLLEISGLNRKGFLKDINFSVNKGEVLGIAGLVGSGRTELARAICGIDKADSGTIVLNGNMCCIDNVLHAIKNGIAFVSEDRKKEGLFLENTLRFNVSFLALSKFIKHLKVNKKYEYKLVDHYIEMLKIKAFSIEQKVEDLSGGNQQKVVLAKWLITNPILIILDEPTRGIDIGAKSEIYSIIYKMASQGRGVVVISSDLPELINICDRLLVMCAGRITGEFRRDEFEQANIMHCATGGIQYAK